MDEVEGSLPTLLHLPEEIRMALSWMEQNGFVRHGAIPYCGLYPATVRQGPNTAYAHFTKVDSNHAGYWLGNHDTSVTSRLAPFIATGADGSYAALWLDDSGWQRFVHMGSGSGSTLACVLANNAVDLLRFLAIGYEETCWPDDFELTPEDAYALQDPDNPYRPPLEFRQWVETSFGVKIPKTASEIVGQAAGTDDDHSDDPFWQWARKVAA
ncbi:SMI1/KNR4 family protein [Mesorhizobium sp. USDA-HM6]|nr:SMI1/KNR4 family protein [Mesorhizobium sp. USDA-HM6]